MGLSVPLPDPVLVTIGLDNDGAFQIGAVHPDPESAQACQDAGMGVAIAVTGTS